MKITKMLHPGDTMTSEERMQAAINLQVPDRVPVSPLIYYFAAYYTGILNADLRDPANYSRAIDRCFDELGPWDALYPLNFYHAEIGTFIFPMKMLEPGIGLPPDAIRQFLEEEIMLPEDYEWITRACERTPRVSYIRLFLRWIPRIWSHIDEGWRSYTYMLPRIAENLWRWRSEYQDWHDRGVTQLYGFGLEAAFDSFSMARGILNFSRDLKKYPEIIARTAEEMTDSYLFILKNLDRFFGVGRIVIALHRTSNDFISPATFEKVALPSLKSLVEKLKSEGINCILHCDGNWDLNLEALRKLPAGCCVAQFDGASDIFKAKEVIGDRICIYGDVPADLLALGSPSEVDEYCHRLIEEVGKGGGFILGSGCELAPNARPENVKAMMESVVKYGYYNGRQGTEPLVGAASSKNA
ncbi:MAG: hypothetical protein JW854_12215 [Actinobacteria bacterium]|nr:hypothetical protein [Actinomycetota bacterium]